VALSIDLAAVAVAETDTVNSVYERSIEAEIKTIKLIF